MIILVAISKKANTRQWCETEEKINEVAETSVI